MTHDTMTYKEFIGSVRFSAEDECFYGKIEAISDLVTFEAQDVKGLKKAFHEAVDDYVAFCKEKGKEPWKSYKGSFNVRVGPEVHRQAAAQAARQGKNLNTFVEEAIRAMIGMEGALTKRGIVIDHVARDLPMGKMAFRAKSKTVHTRAHKATRIKSGKKCNVAGGRK